MRIALDPHTEVGARAGHVLLAERGLERLGLLDRDPVEPDERRARVLDLSTYDVLVTDAPDPEPVVRRALAAGIGAVVWVDRLPGGIEIPPGATVLVGANLAAGIAPALAAHEALAAGPDAEIEIAWTEPGRPRRRGHPVRFPGPVGPRWAVERSPSGSVRRFAVPVDGPWAAAAVHLRADRAPHERVVGVADDAAHLEALALAAGAITVVEGDVPAGLLTVDAIAEAYLDVVLRLGLEVAEWRSEERPSPR